MQTFETTQVVHTADLELLTTPTDDLDLGRLLVTLDTAALAIAGALVLALSTVAPARLLDPGGPWFVPATAVLGVAIVGAVGLHQRRKTSIASVELSRIGRAALMGGLAALVLLQAADSTAPYWTAGAVALAGFLVLALERGAFRAWLKGQRQLGRFVTPVAVVGDRGAAQDFARHLQRHLDSGFRPVAHVDVDDSPLIDLTDDAEALPRVGHLGGDLEDLHRHGVRSAVLLADGLDSDELSGAIRAAERTFEHVQVATNLVGVSHARLVPTPLVGEMTFYLEPLASNWQRVVKRVMDVVVSGLLLVLASPLLLAIALAVRLDGGPTLYSQERVGQDGRRIRIRKFRSMVVDAEDMLDELADDNQRAGPLFKARRDPRVTAVGRILRATSLDELPQLWSILVGDMSLVGPRPALPTEVADFDQLHRRRHEVPPGLTGLWQVEDRDHPDFQRYRRHDVFYVENWSLSLDLAILLQTAVVVVLRGVRALAGAERDEVLE